MEILGTIGSILRKLRLEKDVTLKEVSSSTGISDSLISKYERGLSDPGITALRKFSQYYQVTLDYLFGYTVDKQPITTPENVQELFTKLNEDSKRDAIRYMEFLIATSQTKEGE